MILETTNDLNDQIVESKKIDVRNLFKNWKKNMIIKNNDLDSKSNEGSYSLVDIFQ